MPGRRPRSDSCRTGTRTCSSTRDGPGSCRSRTAPRIFSNRNPFSVGTYLVDGVVAGAWSLKDGRIVLDPFEDLTTRDRRAVEREREALEAFHA